MDYMKKKPVMLAIVLRVINILNGVRGSPSGISFEGGGRGRERLIM